MRCPSWNLHDAAYFSDKCSGSWYQALQGSPKRLIDLVAHQDSNLEPKDYEAATESSRINDIALSIVPVTARETIDL